MASPGVPLKWKKHEIVDSIKKHKGRLTKVAKELGCSYMTIRNHTDPHPEVVELIKHLRTDWNENLLDAAEDTLTDALERRDSDMNNALKSAFFVLNNKGKERGFTPPTKNESEENKVSLSDLAEYARIAEERAKEKLRAKFSEDN